jgi:hypothetical protein
MHEAEVEARQVTLSASERDSVDPIRFETLPSDVQKILRTAITEGSYQECLEGSGYTSEPLQQLRDEVSEHAEEMHVYLLRDGTYYSLAISIEDMSIATHPPADG